MAYDQLITALQEERTGLADRLARVDRALEALGGLTVAAVASAVDTRSVGRRSAPRRTTIPTPHDKAVSKRRTTAPAKMAIPGSPARGANAALRDRLQALVVAAGDEGIGAPAAAKRCAVSRVTALRQMKHLEAIGVIHMTGWSRSARWFAGKVRRL